MKTIVGLVALVLSTITVQSQSNYFHFISAQQQQVKFDAETKCYFIDREINNASEITINKNIISFASNDHQYYRVFINNINLAPLVEKVSFTMEGRDVESGKPVKIGFWFIAGELEEVSYANEALAHSIAYKNISNSTEALTEVIAAAGFSAK